MKHSPCQLTVFLMLSLALSGCESDKPAPQPEVDASQGQSVRASSSNAQPKARNLSLGFAYSVENKRLQALGIPSPATSAYFRALSDAKLEAMAKAGNQMAKTFWVERLADEALVLQRARDAKGNFPEGIEERDAVGNIGQMAYHLSALMQDPTNAMAGYLWGLYSSASTYGGPAEPIVAGIRLAGLRGDDRAVEFEREFRAAHPNLDETDIEMYFESGKHRLEIAAQPRGP